MKVHKQQKRWLFLTFTLMGLLGLFVWPALATADATPPTPQSQLVAAWQRAHTVGAYRYTANVRQTTHPTAKIENAGRQAKTQQMIVDGQIDRAADTMQMKFLSGRQGQRNLELKVEQGKAYGRTSATDEWQTINNNTDLFAPGGDPLGFLVAAENVTTINSQQSTVNDLLEQALPTEYLATLTRYAFDLNGPRYAAYMRDRLQDQLERTGELPPGITLGLARQYLDMKGRGEIWVNRDGLPVRQLMHLEFPPEKGAREWVEAQINTELRDWQQGPSATASAFWHDPLSTLSNPLPLLGLTLYLVQGVLLGFSVSLFMVGLIALIVYYRRSPRLYATFAVAMIVAMLVGPVLQTQRAKAFYDKQTEKKAQADEQQLAAQNIEELVVDQRGQNFNPHLNPLEKATTNWGINELALQPAAVTTCDTATDDDCDDDGLSNDAEVYKLGTSAYDVDSDNDYISDKNEVEGFTAGGNQWYLDPLNPDSNGDGILDTLECTGLRDVESTGALGSNFTATACTDSDSDSTPDLFDFDNDGDGVPDDVDDSPFTVIGSTTTGLTDGKLDFSLAYTGADLPIYVDFTVRPTNPDHLWYNYNVLDWPSNDDEGQITRVFDTTFADVSDYSDLGKASNGDIVLIPLLEFEITYNSANPSASLPISATYSNTTASIPDYSDLSWLDTDALDELGISVNEGEDDQTLLLWIPLSAVEDETGDTSVAWVGRMVYRPPTGSNRWGNAQQVRLNWMLQALTDACDSSGLTDAVDYDTWCADEDNWTTSATIIQTYYDDFMVTALTVREDHGAKAAIIAQPDDLSSNVYEDYLWHLASALEDAFIGIESKGDGSRFGVEEIDDYLAIWGVSGLSVTNFTLANQLELADVGANETTDILNTLFPAAAENDTTNLLFAGEETARTVALGDSAVTISDNALSLDLTAATLDTNAVVRWAPYVYEGSATWDTYDASTYFDDLETALTTLFTDSELDTLVIGDTVSDYDDARTGAVALAQAYYLSVYSGLGATVEIDGVDTGTTSLGSYTLTGTAATNIVSTLLTTMQAYYAELSVVDALTTAATDTTAAASALSASFADSLSLLLESLGMAVNGEATTALTLALAEVGDFYKTGDVDTTDLTSMTAISAMAWASTAATHSANYVIIYALIRTASAVSSMLYTVKLSAIANAAILAEPGSAAMNAAESATRTSKVWAVVTLVVLTAIYLTLYFTGHYDNAFERSAALADTIAKIIVAVIMAAISVIPVVGWLIVGMIALIDLMMMLICEAVGVEAGSTVDLWVCSGVSGALTQAIVYLIFDQYMVVDLSRDDRLAIALDSPTITQTGDNDGYVVGNELNINATITATIRVASPTGLGSDANFAGHNFGQMALDSTFSYTLQSSEIDHHDALSLGETAWRGSFYEGEWSKWHGSATHTATPKQVITLDNAGLNQTTNSYLSESFIDPGIVCWGFFIQGCERQDYKDTFHTNMGDDFIFDVLPATLDDFTELTLVSNNSYRLAWDSRFPTLYDADGDGLISQAKGGADPNDSLWDTDGDGLSDYWE